MFPFQLQQKHCSHGVSSCCTCTPGLVKESLGWVGGP